MSEATGPLRAPHTVAFSYARSVGGATERFLRGLARAEIWGSRLPDGRTVVPPVDHDPVTGAPAEDFVRVGDVGVVRAWTWVADPTIEHPLSQPFAFALIALDGTDTSLLHMVDVDDERDVVTGLRVRADWRETRAGSILDIRAFVPEARETAPVATGEEPVDVTVVSDVRVDYAFEPGLTLSSFYRTLREGRIEGGRCPSCEKVFVPPHSQCPACGTGPMEPVPVPDVGTIESYAVVHLPVPGMELDLPFAWGWIRLDGVDVPFAHLLGGVQLDEVRVGQRVEAQWAPEPERTSSWEAIEYFRPIDDAT